MEGSWNIKGRFRSGLGKVKGKFMESSWKVEYREGL